jgi:hypothetical protein
MFVGSIPTPLRQIIAEHTSHWEVDDVHVGCSGNLTIERTLAGKFRLHSNDVSLYTTALGKWLSGGKVAVKVRPDWREQLGWLEPYLTTPRDTAATLMLCTRLLEGLENPSPYFTRMRDARHADWERLHSTTVEKLSKLDLRLASYDAEDIATFVDRVPDDGALCTFPPFYDDAGGYEDLYAGIDAVFSWRSPSYEILDRDGLHVLLERVRSKRYWLYGTDHRLAGHDQWLRGKVQATSRNVPIYLYASGGPLRLSAPSQRTAQVSAPRLGPGEELEGPLALAELSGPQFNALRSQYLSPAIAPATPGLALAVLAADRLVGCFAFSTDGARAATAGAYLLSDFAVAPTDYRRLSKLVLHAVLSDEVRGLLERWFSRRIELVSTTAFSQRPVSMKYRGMFEQTGRKELDTGPWPYQLQYEAPCGQWSLEDGLDRWREKHGARA